MFADEKPKNPAGSDLVRPGKEKRGKHANPTHNKKLGWKLRDRLPEIALTLVFIIGLCITLYPTVSNWYNSLIRAKAIATYEEAIEKLTPEDFSKIWEEIDQYNTELAERDMRLRLSKNEMQRYEKLLDVSGNGMIGYITIPKLQVKLPIYHGVSDEVLQIAIGHIPGSSLPGAGKTTHTVVSGHRGLPGSRLFTDLDQMKVGDSFVIHVLDREIAYQVDDIQTVEPKDVASLQYEKNIEQATLVTCTPYAVNTHRLLVHGKRVDYKESEFVPTDAIRIDPVLVSTIIAVPVFIVIFIFMLMRIRRENNVSRNVSEKNEI